MKPPQREQGIELWAEPFQRARNKSSKYDKLKFLRFKARCFNMIIYLYIGRAPKNSVSKFSFHQAGQNIR